MNARLYALSGKTPKHAPKGQAARVWSELTTTPELATAINDRIVKSDNPFKTRQDPYRVTLYYILVFKKQGLVVAVEPKVEEPAAPAPAALPTREQLLAMLATLDAEALATAKAADAAVEAAADAAAAVETVEAIIAEATPVTDVPVEPVAEAVATEQPAEPVASDRTADLKAANARRGRRG